MRCTVCLVGVIIQVLLGVWGVRDATIWGRPGIYCESVDGFAEYCGWFTMKVSRWNRSDCAVAFRGQRPSIHWKPSDDLAMRMQLDWQTQKALPFADFNLCYNWLQGALQSDFDECNHGGSDCFRVRTSPIHTMLKQNNLWVWRSNTEQGGESRMSVDRWI